MTTETTDQKGSRGFEPVAPCTCRKRPFDGTPGWNDPELHEPDCRWRQQQASKPGYPGPRRVHEELASDDMQDAVAGRDRHRSRIVPLIVSALEGGLSHSDAVPLAISTYKEVDLLARASNLNQLSAAAIDEIMLYAEAVFRSGSTFSPFEIANRAVATYELAGKEMNALLAKWRGRTAKQRAIDGIAEGVAVGRRGRGRPKRQSHGEGL